MLKELLKYNLNGVGSEKAMGVSGTTRTDMAAAYGSQARLSRLPKLHIRTLPGSEGPKNRQLPRLNKHHQVLTFRAVEDLCQIGKDRVRLLGGVHRGKDTCRSTHQVNYLGQLHANDANMMPRRPST